MESGAAYAIPHSHPILPLPRPLHHSIPPSIPSTSSPISSRSLSDQRLHRLEVAIARGAEGKSGPAFVGDLTEERAVELAGKVASEGFVWGFATIVVGLEVGRQARKDAAKRDQEQGYRDAAEARTAEVAVTAAAAAAAAARAAEAVGEIGGRLEAVERRLAERGTAGERSWLSVWGASSNNGVQARAAGA
jgi:hypothetical protein